MATANSLLKNIYHKTVEEHILCSCMTQQKYLATKIE